MALEYLVPYGLYFPNAADGAAAKAANGGTIDLGTMTPDMAAVTYPTGIVIQLAPWTIYGLTGVPGVPAGAYADWQPSLGLSTVTYSPTTRILTADAVTYATETIVATGEIINLESRWSGTIIFEGIVVTPVAGPPRPVSGRLQIQIIDYTGDGTDGRLLPTTFSLAEAGSRVVVWVFPRGTGYTPIFRTNLSTMLGTAIAGSSTLDTTGGTGAIVSFEATGVVVNEAASTAQRSANALNIKYVALIFCDTTTPTQYLEVGSYVGRGVDHFTTGGFTYESSIVSGIFALPSDVGRSFVVSGAGAADGGYANYMYISPSQFSIGTSWKGPTNTFTVFVPGGGQTAALAFSPTVVWLFGGVTVFRSDDFTGDSSVYLGVLVNVEAGHITAFTATGFTIGDASLQVNTNGRTYYWAALHIPAGDPARAFFTTYRITGTAAAVDQVTDLGFTPVFATARIMVGGVSDWRGPWHTGLTSEAFNGGTVATQGLRAFGDGTIDLGTNVAVDGVDTYGWAMTDGEAIVLGDAQVDPPLDSPPSVEPPSSAPSPNCPVPAPEAEASGTACPTIL